MLLMAQFNAVSYFAHLKEQANDEHRLLSLTAFGAKQRHGRDKIDI
jgi:hypothetical protein